MPSSKSLWQTISLQPLQGLLDTRSRPADIPLGAYRWKQNFSISPEERLCRRGGHERFHADADAYTNYDYHRQGKTREPVTLQFESTASDATRRYFLGTESTVSVLDETTGLYTDIVTGLGATGSRWKVAELKDVLILTNDVDDVRYYNLDGSGTGTINHLTAVLHVGAVKLAVQHEGFMLLMNLVQDGERHANRIYWSDLNRPTAYDPDEAGLPSASITGFQDLDPGEIILNAAPMLGRLYVYTNRGIWWMQPSGDDTTVFQFVHVYQEPKNQTGCLAYENTLVSTGSEHWYMGRDAIYHFTPYIPAPIREDWLHLASGVIYTQEDTKLTPGGYCSSPVAEYVPTKHELWISWPSTGNAGINNWSLVAQIEQKTADVIETGYTSLVNYRRNPTEGQLCDERQELLGASGLDWCIKSIGEVFLREYAILADADDLTVDLPATATYRDDGYNSILRGFIPLGLQDRDKIVRNVLLDHDTRIESVPCAFRLRIGNAYSLVDPNATAATCSPQWRQMTDKSAACPDSNTNTALAAKGQRANIGTQWPVYEQGRFLYFELTVLAADGTAAIGGDTCLQRVDFDAMALPKR